MEYEKYLEGVPISSLETLSDELSYITSNNVAVSFTGFRQNIPFDYEDGAYYIKLNAEAGMITSGSIRFLVKDGIVAS